MFHTLSHRDSLALLVTRASLDYSLLRWGQFLKPENKIVITKQSKANTYSRFYSKDIMHIILSMMTKSWSRILNFKSSTSHVHAVIYFNGENVHCHLIAGKYVYICNLPLEDIHIKQTSANVYFPLPPVTS